jgi:hypothetical protein
MSWQDLFAGAQKSGEFLKKRSSGNMLFPCPGDGAELPSGGDSSYPGFVELSPNRAVMSWYSSHEKDADGKTITAIYMADLEIAE